MKNALTGEKALVLGIRSIENRKGLRICSEKLPNALGGARRIFPSESVRD